jgi:hypothetical protein
MLNKTYAEAITEQARKQFDNFQNGGNGRIPEGSAIIGFIYDVLERDVDMDIDDEYLKLRKESKTQ